MSIATIPKTNCPHCGRPISIGCEQTICRECQTPFHRACWHEHHGCTHHGGCDCREALPLPLLSGRELSLGQTPTTRHAYTGWLIVALMLLTLTAAAFIASSCGVSSNTLLVMGVILTALGFDFVNGMNDSGNAIATVISTRVLTPITALLMAAFFNFVGAVVMEGVAKSIAGKIIDTSATSAMSATPLMILCGLLGAIGWAYTMARIGLPISMSHALIGGLVGVLLLAHIPINSVYIGEILMWMILAPVLGITFGWLLMVLIMWLFHRVPQHKVNGQFRIWQVLSSALMAFSHGANDAQKAMGIITLSLVTGGLLQVAPGSDGPHIPLWVKFACATTIALGTAFGGKRVISTLGHKIFKLAPVHGFAAEFVAACTIQLATMMHIPISTTHVISSSILGVGSSKRVSAVRWGVAGNIVSAWIFTIPTCGIVAALLYALIQLCGWR